MLRTISVRRRRIDQAAAVSYRPRRYWLSLLALMAGPVASETTNAVVIDFGQGRLILGWIGLWLLTAVTFAACADKRLQLMSRLAEYLDARAPRREASPADAASRQPTRRAAPRLAEVPGAYAPAHAHSRASLACPGPPWPRTVRIRSSRLFLPPRLLSKPLP